MQTTPIPTKLIMIEIAGYYFEKHESKSVHDKRFVLLNYHNDKLPQKLSAYIKQYPKLNIFYSRLFDSLKQKVEKLKELSKIELYLDIKKLCREMFGITVEMPRKFKPSEAEKDKTHKVDLNSKTVAELRKIASDLKISGRSALTKKQELINAIRLAQNKTKTPPQKTKSPINIIKIPQNDQYEVVGVKQFKILLDGKAYRDIPINLSKWKRDSLNIFAKHFDIKDYKKLKKPELFNLIKDRIVFD